MKAFIANFGHGNYLWDDCLKRSSIAVFDDADLHVLWLAGDRDGYINCCVKTKKTATGITPPRSVAARWYSLSTVVSTTENDLWIHRQKNDIWWTISRPGEVDTILAPANNPTRPSEQVYILHKPAERWSNKNKKGEPLTWGGLHPRAREFLFTEGTLQQLNPDNAEFAEALINGDDLKPWYSRTDWKKKAEKSKKEPATSFNARDRAVFRMVMTAQGTVAGANGQQVMRTVKNKELRLEKHEFEKYLKALLELQEGLCAITGLRLQYDGEFDDEEFLCSLDR